MSQQHVAGDETPSADEQNLRAALREATAERVHDLLTEVWRENVRLKARIAHDAPRRRTLVPRKSAGESNAATPRSTWDAPSRPASPDDDEHATRADEAAAARIAALEEANSVLEAQAQAAERRAKAAQDAYRTMWSQTSTTQRLDQLNSVVRREEVPPEFRHLSAPELLPKVLDEYALQRGVILQLKQLERTHRDRANALNAEVETLREDVDLANQHIRSQEDQFGDRLRQVEELHSAQEWLLQQNKELHDMLADANRSREGLQKMAKAKDRVGADDRARLDDARSSLAEEQRKTRELEGQLRELTAERDMLNRQLESANRRADGLERRLTEVAQSQLEGGTSVKSVNDFSRKWGTIVTSNAASGGGGRRHGSSSLAATHSAGFAAPKSSAAPRAAGSTHASVRPTSSGAAASVSPMAQSAPAFSGGLDGSKSSMTIVAQDPLPPMPHRASEVMSGQPPSPRGESSIVVPQRSGSASAFVGEGSTPDATAVDRTNSGTQSNTLSGTAHDSRSASLLLDPHPKPAGAGRRGSSASPPARRQVLPQQVVVNRPAGAGPGRKAPPRPVTDKLIGPPRHVDPHLRDSTILQKRLMPSAERHRQRLAAEKPTAARRGVVAAPKSLQDLSKPPPRPSH